MNTMADESIPILALPAGSVNQFFVATIPLFGVYCYFLYLAATRPNIADPDDEHFYDPRIRLMDILYVFLAKILLTIHARIYKCVNVYFLSK